MGCTDGLAKLFLVVVNLVFMVLGLISFICGFILRYGKSIYEPYISVGIANLKTVVKDTSLADFDNTDIDLGAVLQAIALGLILGGLALLAISGSGCCGACYKISLLLYIYVAVIVVFVIGESVALGVLYGKPDIVKSNLKSGLSGFGGMAASDPYSLTWNIAMIQFKCCGVDSYNDFATYATSWETSPGGIATIVTPIACCKTLPTGGTSGDLACATSYSAATNYGETGCYKRIWDLSLGDTANVVPALVICGLIQVALIVFAILIIKSKSKDKIGAV